MRTGSARDAVTRLQISMTSSSALSEIPRFCLQVRWEEAESTENAANKSLRQTLILRYSRPKWGAIVFCRDTRENQYSMSPLNFKLFSGCFQNSVSLSSLAWSCFPLRRPHEWVYFPRRVTLMITFKYTSTNDIGVNGSFLQNEKVYFQLVHQRGICFARQSSLSVDDAPGSSGSIRSASVMVKLSTPRYFSCEPASYTAELS